MSELTPHGFEHGMRETLRYRHGFEHDQLNRVSGMFNDTLTKMGRSSLSANHFDDAMKHIEEHADWKRLSETQRGAITATLKEHLGIKEPLPEAANDDTYRRSA